MAPSFPIKPQPRGGPLALAGHNVNTGAFEVYNITSNQLTSAASLGQVGLDWALGGFAAISSTGSAGASPFRPSRGGAEGAAEMRLGEWPASGHSRRKSFAIG